MSRQSATFTWRVMNLVTGLDGSEQELRRMACRESGIDPERLRGFRIANRSLDARRRGDSRRFRYVHHVDVVTARKPRSRRFQRALRSGKVAPSPEVGDFRIPGTGEAAGKVRAVVVGAGPGGMYAALILAMNGVQVDLIDRGAGLKQRGKDLAGFLRSRLPNPESNLLFGEGGAGTYSDGKLYTRVDHPLEVPCLEELVACGAPPEILFDSRAHIGTDRLHKILPRFRARLESLGVRLHFRTRMYSMVLEEGPSKRVWAISTGSGEIPCDALFLAIGHSSRDSWWALKEQGVVFDPKPFQVGVRVEHPQEIIDRGRYGQGPEASRLGPASYNLVCRAGGGLPSAFSFCMCPGGRIVASVNQPGRLCTNGMSNSAHSSPWASAAVVTTIVPENHGAGPFAGVDLQVALEEKFFQEGGGDYSAPAQRVDDFLAGRETAATGRSSYSFGVQPGRIDRMLPPRTRDALRRALLRFDHQIPGFAGPEGLMVGVESRSSCPVRMTRHRDNRLAKGFRNLYPVGEGAGYAGGIMSAAIDGARSAQAFLRTVVEP